MNVCIIELWLKDFVEEHQESRFIKKTSEECYILFCDWLVDKNIKYDCNSIKFGVKLSRLSISKDAIENIRMSKGNSRVFDIWELTKYFNKYVYCIKYPKKF